jgi:hypothetical protein
MPLPVVIPLPIRPPPKPSLSENLFINFPLFSQVNLGLKLFNFPSHLLRNAASKFLFPTQTAHDFLKNEKRVKERPQ